MSSDTSTVAPPVDHGEETSFLAIQAWFSGSPWRLTGGWYFIAGLAAAGGLTSLGRPWIAAVMGLVLAGAIWGALWSQLAVRGNLPATYTLRRPAWPYVTPESPAGRIAGWQRPGALGRLVRVAVPLAGLALLLAWPLGRSALLATAAAIVAAVLGAAVVRAGLSTLSSLLRGLVVAGLPFALGVLMPGAWPDQPLGLWLLALAGGYILLTAASQPRPAGQAGWLPLLLAVGGAALLAGALLFAGLPMAAVVSLLLMAPPLLSMSGVGRVDRAGAAQAWWLAAVLCSALAVATGIG